MAKKSKGKFSEQMTPINAIKKQKQLIDYAKSLYDIGMVDASKQYTQMANMFNTRSKK